MGITQDRLDILGALYTREAHKILHGALHVSICGIKTEVSMGPSHSPPFTFISGMSS